MKFYVSALIFIGFLATSLFISQNEVYASTACSVSAVATQYEGQFHLGFAINGNNLESGVYKLVTATYDDVGIEQFNGVLNAPGRKKAQLTSGLPVSEFDNMTIRLHVVPDISTCSHIDYGGEWCATQRCQALVSLNSNTAPEGLECTAEQDPEIDDCLARTVTRPAVPTLATYDAADLCRQAGPLRSECEDTCAQGELWTSIGCIKTSPEGIVEALFRIGAGVGGGFALLFILWGSFQIAISTGDPERLKSGRQTILSAIIGLLTILFAATLLSFIGVEILQLPGF